MSLFDRDKSGERLPVSLITGFLGSGKTTLLNKLLASSRHGGQRRHHQRVRRGRASIICWSRRSTAKSPCWRAAASAAPCAATWRRRLRATAGEARPRRNSAVPAHPGRDDRPRRSGADRPAAAEQSAAQPLRAARHRGHHRRCGPRRTAARRACGGRQAGRDRGSAAADQDRSRRRRTRSSGCDARLARLNPGATLTTVLNGEIEPERAVRRGAVRSRSARAPTCGAGSTRRPIATPRSRRIDHAHDARRTIARSTASASPSTTRSTG